MMENQNEMTDDNQSLTRQKKNVTKTARPADRIGFDKIHVIITKNKQNSWIDDLDEREKLSRIQRVFH